MMIQENNNKKSIGFDSGDINSLQLSEIWSLVWNNKKWYVLSLIVFAVAAAFYIYATPKTYTRSAKVIVDESAENSKLRDLVAFTSNMPGMRRSGGTNVHNEIEAFVSPDLMEKVVKRLGYETSYTEHQFLRKRELFTKTPFKLSLGGDNPISSFSFDVVKDGTNSFYLKNFVVKDKKIESDKIYGKFNNSISTPVGVIMLVPTDKLDLWNNTITVSWVNSMSRAKSFDLKFTAALSGKESSVVTLSLNDNFPIRANNILSTIIDIYNEEWVDNKNKAAVNTTQFINERLGIIEKELGNVEGNLKEYKEKNKITDIKAVSEAYLKQSSEYGTKAFDVNNQLSMAKFIREYINDPAHSDDLIPANSGLSSTAVENQIKSYNDCLLSRNRLLSESSSENPTVAELNEALIKMKMAVNRSVESLIATLKLQSEKIQSQENEIMERIASTSGQQLQLLSIERQQKVKEQLYVYLLQKREENEIAALVNVGNTRLIMEPNGSPFPISPRTSMVAVVVLFLGLGLPFLVFFLIDRLDTRVKTKDDVTGNVQAPFLAEIPLFAPNKKRLLLKYKKNQLDNNNTRILVEAGNRDVINEAFRVLRTNIDLMTANNRNGCNKFMVTSFNPNAGKTFLIMNIAATMALKGTRTLLLDLDLRKATLSKALEMNRTGVSSYLSGKNENIDDNLYNIAKNLYLMPVGTLPPNPAELLISDKFKELIAKLEERFEYIFIDCPPVDVVSDTGIIAGYADMTIFVMRAGFFDKRDLPSLEAMYEGGQYKRLSIVLNGVESYGRRGYGSYGRYGYGYGYGGYGYGYGYSNEEVKE